MKKCREEDKNAFDLPIQNSHCIHLTTDYNFTAQLSEPVCTQMQIREK